MSNTGRKKTFKIVTPYNLKSIAERLTTEGGRIIIAQPGPDSYKNEVVDADLDLFANPSIDPGEKFLCTNRGHRKIKGIIWQTKWQNDRNYFLHFASAKTNPFKRSLTLVGQYEFIIGFEFQEKSTSLFPKKSITLFIPKGKHFKPAFIYAIKILIRRMNLFSRQDGSVIPIGKLEIEKMADYAEKDLRDKKFKKALVAWKEADSLL
jgi:hypothetical protein